MQVSTDFKSFFCGGQQCERKLHVLSLPAKCWSFLMTLHILRSRPAGAPAAAAGCMTFKSYRKLAAADGLTQPGLANLWQGHRNRKIFYEGAGEPMLSCGTAGATEAKRLLEYAGGQIASQHRKPFLFLQGPEMRAGTVLVFSHDFANSERQT